MKPIWTTMVLATSLGLLGGCSLMPHHAPQSRVSVLLLPQTDEQGRPIPTAVEVKANAQTVVLNQPFAVAETGADGRVNQRVATINEVQTRYADLLRVQPPSAESVTLNFLPGSSQLTPESARQLPDLIERARVRAGGEILVVGHTDRVGRVEANDTLSLQRAQAVAAQFKERGFPDALISTVGRGEREPLVPTPDEVAEPRNRRAEIIIR